MCFEEAQTEANVHPTRSYEQTAFQHLLSWACSWLAWHLDAVDHTQCWAHMPCQRVSVDNKHAMLGRLLQH